MLTREQQADFVVTYPATFTPVRGGWGVNGATSVRLPEADPAAVDEALTIAWRSKSAMPAGKPRSQRQSVCRGSGRSR
jgi:hypothetical protein